MFWGVLISVIFVVIGVVVFLVKKLFSKKKKISLIVLVSVIIEKLGFFIKDEILGVIIDMLGNIKGNNFVL